MSATETRHDEAPRYGRDGAPCPTCRAPLAADQRYCLQCGRRRPQVRLALLDQFAAERRHGHAAAAASAADGPSGRTRRFARMRNSALGLGALLAVAFGIGALVGHAATSGSTPSPKTVTVRSSATGGGAAGGGTPFVTIK